MISGLKTFFLINNSLIKIFFILFVSLNLNLHEVTGILKFKMKIKVILSYNKLKNNAHESWNSIGNIPK